MAKRAVYYCECIDSDCPAHKNWKCGAKARKSDLLYRVDMEDRTGTRFCPACGQDAMESGFFSGSRNFYSC